MFTGYSSLVMAQALPDDGRIVGCDMSEEYTNVARKYWKDAGVDSKIDLHIGPAMETLDRLIANGEINSFDMAFIDADKQNNPGYLERCLKLVRPNGLILVDNVLRAGKILDDTADAETKAVQEFNPSLRNRKDIEAIMLPLFDGLTLIRKK